MTREDKIASDIIFDELEAKHKDGYLFRGEPEEYESVTSSLYRATPPVAREDVSVIERDFVNSCLHHCYEDAKIQKWKADGILQEHALKKLSEIQHFGGVTNLIDFTTCFYTALFFACDKWPEHDGRIIVIHPDLVPALNYVEPTNQDVLIPWGDYDYIRRDNGYPRERAEAQKSVFIHAKTGMLNADDYEVISIPSRFKTDFREGLSVDLNINRRSVYPDTIGFVDNNRQNRSLEFMFTAEEQLGKGDYESVIKSCGKSTNEQAHSYVYHIWGLAHLQLGETQEAIDKFERALTIDRWQYKANGNSDLTNGAGIATETAKNIAEGKRGEYPTPSAIFSLNHSLGKGRPLPSSGGMMTMPHILYTLPPYTLAYQFKRWYVLNLFYDYNELWDALPQLPEGARQETQEWRRNHEELANLRVFAMSGGEKTERSHEDRNRDCYLDPVSWDPEFYRPFRDDEIENPLKSWMQVGGAEPPAHHNKEES